MTRLPLLRARTLALYMNALLLATAGAACSAQSKGAAKASVVACAKATENQLVGQATSALLSAASKDPGSVTAFLDSLALDAAQAGVSDAIGFVTCVAEAVKAKLSDLASHASLDSETYTKVMSGLNGWEAAHPTH